MVIEKEPAKHASTPSQKMDSAGISIGDNLAKPSKEIGHSSNITMSSDMNIPRDDIQAGGTNPMASATKEPTKQSQSKSTSLPKGTLETSPSMTGNEFARGVQQMREFPDAKKKSISRNPDRWAIPSSQWASINQFEHAGIVPTKNTTTPFHVQVGSYVQRWALWACEIRDEKLREKIIHRAMETMERVWFRGIDVGLFPKHQQDKNMTGRRGPKKDKNDEFLNYDDEIETQPIIECKLSRSGLHYRIMSKEFKETRANIDAINTRIAERDIAYGEKLYDDYVKSLENGRVSIADWKNRTDITASNPLGRDMLRYAFHEVFLAKQEIRKLKAYLPSMKTASQKKNTYARISEKAALVTRWLAIAIELEKVRPKDGTDTTDESEAESAQLSVKNDTSTPDSTQQRVFPAPKEVSNIESLIPMSSITTREDTNAPLKDVLTSNLELKAPLKNSIKNDEAQEQVRTSLTPKTPIVRRVRLHPPKPPTPADKQHKQETESKQSLQTPVKSKRNKRKTIEDSDSDFAAEEKPVRRQRERRSKRRRIATNYKILAGSEAEEDDDDDE